MSLQVSDIIEAVRTYGEAELKALLIGISPMLAAVPVDALLALADSVAKTIESKNELAAMQSAVSAADVAADAAEAEALKPGALP